MATRPLSPHRADGDAAAAQSGRRNGDHPLCGNATRRRRIPARIGIACVIAPVDRGAPLLFQKLELWHAALFGDGYGSVLVTALAARAFNARLGTRLTAPLYRPPQSLAMLKALIDMKLTPQFWAKTEHGSAASTTLPGRLLQGRKPTTSSSWNSPYRTEAAPFRPSRR